MSTFKNLFLIGSWLRGTPLVVSITGASDGLSVTTTSWVETISSERTGVDIFLVVVAFLVVVVVVIVVIFAVEVVTLASVVSATSVGATVSTGATVEVVTTVEVGFGGVPVGPTPILNPFVTQFSNSWFLGYSSNSSPANLIPSKSNDRFGQTTTGW